MRWEDNDGKNCAIINKGDKSKEGATATKKATTSKQPSKIDQEEMCRKFNMKIRTMPDDTATSQASTSNKVSSEKTLPRLPQSNGNDRFQLGSDRSQSRKSPISAPAPSSLSSKATSSTLSSLSTRNSSSPKRNVEEAKLQGED